MSTSLIVYLFEVAPGEVELLEVLDDLPADELLVGAGGLLRDLAVDVAEEVLQPEERRHQVQAEGQHLLCELELLAVDPEVGEA